ncbi:MAG: monofunctional biosynthetic peptidoglycan transglycosylase [Cocleimonas sp.]|nr:monofunctional biosynthetic peptidoglycan transglycosylase [Cocleimonas sp.]
MKINRFIQSNSLDKELKKSSITAALPTRSKWSLSSVLITIIFKLLNLLKWIVLSIVILYLAILLIFRWLPLPTSAFIWHQNQLAAHQPKIYQPARYEWINWEEISPEIAVAVMAAEDQRFPTHWGIDTIELRKVLSTAYKGKGSVRGASTLTQQLAKNLFLWNGRSYSRKVVEAFIAISLELVWSKKRILEVYLNVAQFANVTFGVKASSKLLFHKAPKELTLEQAAFLAAVLPTPAKSDVHNPSDSLKKRQRWILKQMKQLGGVAYLKKLKK